MILCLDIGNTHIYGGVFVGKKIKLRFRYPSLSPCTSDTFGLFLKNVLRENKLDPDSVKAISISSVVPSMDYSVNAACIKYFSITPLELKPGTKTGLNINTKNPLELGADRIANSVGAMHQFPNRNLIIMDLGTATTICVVTKDNSYLGGAILPGLKTSMEALCQNAEKLSPVDIVRPKKVLGKTTATNMQSGIYYGQLGATKEIVSRLKAEVFPGEETLTIGTGGYAYFFEKEDLFDVNVPDLVLQGVYLVWERNSK